MRGRRSNPGAFRCSTIVALLGLALGVAVRAQQPPDPNQGNPPQDSVQYDQTPAVPATDPPSRVVRLSVAQGTVSVEPASVDEFSPAEVNAPLTTGDRVWTGGDSLAELQAGLMAARMGATTDLTVTAMTDTLAQFGLGQGSLHLVTYALDPESTTELDTPNVALTVQAAGDVRVNVDPVGAVYGCEGALRRGAGGRQWPAADAGSRTGGPVLGTQWSFYAVAADAQRGCAGRFFEAAGPGVREWRGGGAELSEYGHGRRCRSVSVWNLASAGRLRERMVPGGCAGGMATVLLWPMDVGCAVGMDVDRGGAVGICAVPLRTLGDLRWAVGMDSWAAGRASGVRAGAGGLRASGERRLGVVPAGTEGAVCTVVSLEHAVSEPRERE